MITVDTKKKILTLSRNIRRNTPRISKKLSKSHTKVDRSLLVSVAKYYEALDKLAKK